MTRDEGTGVEAPMRRRRTNLRLPMARMLFCSALLLSGCSPTDGDPAALSKTSIETTHTNLSAESCAKEIDKTDPNETPYLVCPGVAGYALIVRRVDAGRRSIDVVDPERRVFPLEYQEFVTRHMSTLAHQAEWRIAMKDGKQ